jgi:ABC-2 type transport system ATP-binding protein
LFEDRKKWVLKISNLEQQEKLLTKSLPGGIKQRLALGTAVIHKPKIVFLDEPTSGVDPISRRSFWDLINDLSNEGITVLVTTHYLEEAEYCNNIILMDAGNIIAEGSSTELKKNYIKRKIFEIESSQTIKLFEFLKKLDFVANISIFGNNLHVSFFDENANSQSISKLLENSTLSINNVTEIIPTLEDVFIHLLEKKNDK